MANFFKHVITLRKLQFQRLAKGTQESRAIEPQIGISGVKRPGALGSFIDWVGGARLASPFGLTQRFQVFCPGNQAITDGIAAAAGITILAAQALADGARTVVSAGFTQPDVPRNLRFVSNEADVGDGTFVGAGAAWVTVTGLNQFGQSVTESVALNGTNAVFSIQCFSRVDSISFPPRFDADETVTTTCGPALGLDRPVSDEDHLIEISRKESVDTSYTIETLPATVAVGEGYAPSTSDLEALPAGGGVVEDEITFLDADLEGTMPDAPFLAEILSPGGTEVVTVVDSNSAGGTTTLDILRGLHGHDGAIVAKPAGSMINALVPMSITPAITADDRLLLSYYSALI